MKYVLLRDDDTNATTPPAFLERLYAPFLDRDLAVNLAVIPDVRANACGPEGRLEKFIVGPWAGAERTLPIPGSPALVEYVRERGYRVVQHGLHHEMVDGQFEFDRADRRDIRRRLQRGQALLAEAGFATPRTFVAPWDKVSAVSLSEIARLFRVLSCGWYEMRRLPATWVPSYLAKKALHRPHWRVGGLTLLSHPGCLLSRFRPAEGILDAIRQAIDKQPITVLVTHWWEYFPDGRPDEAFIAILHETAAYLASRADVRVIGFDELPSGTHASLGGWPSTRAALGQAPQ